PSVPGAHHGVRVENRHPILGPGLSSPICVIIASLRSGHSLTISTSSTKAPGSVTSSVIPTCKPSLIPLLSVTGVSLNLKSMMLGRVVHFPTDTISASTGLVKRYASYRAGTLGNPFTGFLSSPSRSRKRPQLELRGSGISQRPSDQETTSI